MYDLVVDKGGFKLKPSAAVDAPSLEEMRANPDKYKKGLMTMGSGMYEGIGVPVRSLASQLGNVLGKPVIDVTGLTGIYDIKLHFRPEETAAESGDTDAPSVFSAVQERLGPKLLSSKEPVEMLLVDVAQKPGPN